jgi:hypothetical protein
LSPLETVNHIRFAISSGRSDSSPSGGETKNKVE